MDAAPVATKGWLRDRRPKIRSLHGATKARRTRSMGTGDACGRSRYAFLFADDQHWKMMPCKVSSEERRGGAALPTLDLTGPGVLGTGEDEYRYGDGTRLGLGTGLIECTGTEALMPCGLKRTTTSTHCTAQDLGRPEPCGLPVVVSWLATPTTCVVLDTAAAPGTSPSPRRTCPIPNRYISSSVFTGRMPYAVLYYVRDWPGHIRPGGQRVRVGERAQADYGSRIRTMVHSIQ